MSEELWSLISCSHVFLPRRFSTTVISGSKIRRLWVAGVFGFVLSAHAERTTFVFLTFIGTWNITEHANSTLIYLFVQLLCVKSINCYITLISK